MDASSPPETLKDRVRLVRDRMDLAARASGREPGAVKLIAVSKGQPAGVVVEALGAGVTDFGENYAQELVAKERLVRDAAESTADANASAVKAAWHYQGTLQRRKIKDLVPIVHSFQSVARREELEEISRRASTTMTCLLEVNIGREPAKNGVDPSDVEMLLDHARTLERIRVAGLMTVPPDDDDPVRWFAALRDLAAKHDLPEISMGMSSDYEAAIREGATIVRVGTALFGPRAPRVA